jgi:hypothetical protein
MKRTIAISALLILLCVSISFAQTFGAGLTLDTPTPVSTILENPDNYLGKKVQVKGLIVDVCAKRGCWMYIAGDKPFQKLRFKVVDGEMVFPMTARGKTATVEGILQKFVLTKEDVIARQKHHAEETGEPFDPTSVTSGETFYQLRGVGAVIQGL